MYIYYIWLPKRCLIFRTYIVPQSFRRFWGWVRWWGRVIFHKLLHIPSCQKPSYLDIEFKVGDGGGFMLHILLQIPFYHKPPYRSDPLIEWAHWHSQPGTRAILIASPSAKLFLSCWHFLAHCSDTRLALGSLEHLSRNGILCGLGTECALWSAIWNWEAGLGIEWDIRFLCALYKSLN